MRFAACVSVLVALSVPWSARADESMVPLAASGDWAAVEHRPTMIGAPDVCLVINTRSGVAFRADANGMEMRVMNPAWSLPPAVSGRIEAGVGAYWTKFSVTSNTSTMVMAEMETADYRALFDAMDKGSMMTVTVGAAPQIKVSLAGSTRVMAAFKTCSGIRGGAARPGSNPFSE